MKLTTSKRLEALEKASESNTSIQASRFDDLRKASTHSLAHYLAKKKSEYNAINAGYDALLSKTSSKEAASKALLSLNLYPTKSFETRLKNINYPTSIEHALAKDWQKVGNDLWKKISGSVLAGSSLIGLAYIFITGRKSDESPDKESQ